MNDGEIKSIAAQLLLVQGSAIKDAVEALIEARWRLEEKTALLDERLKKVEPGERA